MRQEQRQLVGAVGETGDEGGDRPRPRQRRQEKPSAAKTTRSPHPIMRMAQPEISQHRSVTAAGGDQPSTQHFTAQVYFKIVVTVTLLCGLIVAATHFA